MKTFIDSGCVMRGLLRGAIFSAWVLCGAFIGGGTLYAATLSPAGERAPAILLAGVYDFSIDPAPYLVSEKFDGVRGIWDGKVLRFRSGNIVHAPAWFTAKLPPQALDGELWLARGKFDALSGIVRRSVPDDDEWRQVHFMVFELPDAPGSFETRYRRIKEIVAETRWPQLIAVEQFRVANRAALRRRLDAVIEAGGEGLALHLADAPYASGRGNILLKLKPQFDTEAVVVEHLAGKGKFSGIMGALRVEMPDGKRFVIGSGFSDEMRRHPPVIGSAITYTYRSMTPGGVPRFASFLRMREAF